MFLIAHEGRTHVTTLQSHLKSYSAKRTAMSAFLCYFALKLVQFQKIYVVKDDIETGYGNIIPLWQFGLTY